MMHWFGRRTVRLAGHRANQQGLGLRGAGLSVGPLASASENNIHNNGRAASHSSQRGRFTAISL